MTNWQERIKQAFLIRQTAERQKTEDEYREKMEAERRKKEKELTKQQNLEKAKTVMKNIGAYSILERAKEVWGTGRVFEEIDKDRYKVRTILEVQYDGCYSESGGSDYSYVPQTYRGKWRDRLIIEISYCLFPDIRYIDVEDLHEFGSKQFASDHDFPGRRISSSDTFIGGVVKIDFNNYIKTRGEVEEEILGFCEKRVASKTLPLDYKSRWAR